MKKLERILTYVLLGFFIVYDTAALSGPSVPAEEIMLYLALGCCIGLGLFFVKEIVLRLIHHKKGE